MKVRILIAAAVVVVIAVAVSLYVSSRPRNRYSGTVETREIQIGSKIGGRVTEVLVEEGQMVKAGAPLVRFEANELRAQRAQAGAAQMEAQADLDRLQRGNRPEEIAQAEAAAAAQLASLDAARNGSRPQEIDQAKADYAAAQADAVNAETSYQRLRKLVETGTVSRQQFDDARDKRDAVMQRAESSRQHLALLEAGTRQEELRAAEARYRQAAEAAALSRRGSRKEDIDAAMSRLVSAQGHVAELDARLREAELAAPADAVVETVSVRTGDLVTANRIVINLLESSQLWVKVYLPETELSLVHLGQQAIVQVDSYPGRGFTGRLGEISSQAEFLPRNVQTHNDREHQVFSAKVFVDNPNGVLKSGMSATVRLQ